MSLGIDAGSSTSAWASVRLSASRPDFDSPWIGGRTVDDVRPQDHQRQSDDRLQGGRQGVARLRSRLAADRCSSTSASPTGVIPTGLPALYAAAIDAATFTGRTSHGLGLERRRAVGKLSPTTKVGVSYRLTTKYKAYRLRRPEFEWLGGSAHGLSDTPPAARTGDARAEDRDCPDTFIVSASQKLDDQWEMLGDLSWTGWSSRPRSTWFRSPYGLDGTIRADPGHRASATPGAWRSALNYKLRDDLEAEVRRRLRPDAGQGCRHTGSSRCRTTTAPGCPSAPSGSRTSASALDVGSDVSGTSRMATSPTTRPTEHAGAW